MKKLIVLALMALTLAACGDVNVTSTGGDSCADSNADVNKPITTTTTTNPAK